MEHVHGAEGQATAEYVALVAIVAVALALAAGLTSGGLASNVLAGMQRGLCSVAGATCARPIAPRADLDPCPLERGERVEWLSGTLAAIRVGASGTLTVVRTSDGHVTVTLADGGEGGGETGAGVGFRIGGLTLGETVKATFTTTWTAGRSWTLPDIAAARRFVAAYGAKATIGGRIVDQVRSRCSLLCDAIGWRPHAQLPEPDEVFETHGAAAALASSLGVVSGDLALAGLLGRSVRRDGTTTWYLQLDGVATARLGLSGLALAGEAASEAVLAYSLDRRGRPLTLVVHLAGEAGAQVGMEAARAAGRASGSTGSGAAVELDAKLDLLTSANRTAATDVLDALAHPGARSGELPSRLRTLGSRLATAGELDRRVYALQTSATGVGGTIGIAAGMEAAGGLERTTRGLRLLSAETRLPGLPFLPRDDCRPA